jgi:acetyl-CoA C-acetyltransferase
MGGHAEYTAMKADVSRADQDEFAYQSHMKAIAAMEGGKFDAELVKVEVPGRKGQVSVVDKDENPRADTTIESLAKLKPVFGDSAPEDVKEYSVTAGNASALNDGAAALLVTSQRFAEENGLEIMARIRNYSVGATDPQDLFFAPIDAVKKLMEKDGTKIGDYDLIEANEAFAVQALADGRALGWDWDRVNVHGGAVALGHPIGASGARILVTLLGAMQDRNANLGLATLCLGGGNAVAVSVERV